MNPWLVLGFFLLTGAIALFVVRTAYREGVCDGYRYAKRPFDPRYANLFPVLRAAKLVAPRPDWRPPL